MEREIEQIDKRFDDLGRDVNARFEQVDKRLDEQGRRIGDLSHRLDHGFARIDDRLDGLHRLLVRISVGGFATVLVALLISPV